MLNDDGSAALDRKAFPHTGTSKESLAELNTVFEQWHGAAVDDTGDTFGGLIEKVYPQLNQ